MCGLVLAAQAQSAPTVNHRDLHREISISTTVDLQIVPNPRPAPSTVTVKAGDNDVKIAKRLGISAAQLRKANPGVNWSRLQIGQKLKTSVAAKAQAKPKTTAKAPTKSQGSHVVKSGENDWIIAKKYGIAPSALAKLNPKVNWSKLQPGQKIVVPAPKMTTAKATTPAISTKRVRIIKDSVYVRSGPNTTAKPLTKVTKDRVASVIDRTGDWYKIKFEGGTVGWVRQDMLKAVSAQEASKLLALAKKGSASTKVAAKSKSTSAKPPVKVAALSSRVSGSLIETAKSNLGIRYRWGGTSRGGFDCSGFVSWVYAKHGVKLPRTSIQQSTHGAAVPKSSLATGDLVFFKTTRSNRVSHVGIYIGGGKFIHASSGTGSVTISSLNDGYYSKRYAGARRVTGAKVTASIDGYGGEERETIAAAQRKSESEVARAKADAEKQQIEAAAKAAEQASKEAPAKVTVGADVVSK